MAWFLALVIMATTEVGPVVTKLTANHGVHVGDLLALLGAAAVTVASFGLAYLTRPAPGSRHRS